jgi:hypothetical protein
VPPLIGAKGMTVSHAREVQPSGPTRHWSPRPPTLREPDEALHEVRTGEAPRQVQPGQLPQGWAQSAVKASVMEWHKANAERLKEHNRAWNRANPEKKRAHDRRCREKKRAKDPQGYRERKRAQDRRYRERKRSKQRGTPNLLFRLPRRKLPQRACAGGLTRHFGGRPRTQPGSSMGRSSTKISKARSGLKTIWL